MNYLSVSKVLGLCLSLALFTACDKREEEAPSIASIAVANPDFQVLEDAAIRGDVAIVLSNKNPNDSAGNYTVFAPTNAAFARLGLVQAADLDALQKPFLTNTLLYHVAGGLLPGSTLQPGGSSPSALAGLTRRYIKRGNDLYVNGSRILATDVRAANGVIHVVDKVLLATGGNVVESAVALQSGGVFVKPELTFLVAAVVHCNLQGLLSEPGNNYTVFAPTDQAFKDAGIPSIDAINQMDVTALTGILANHVLYNNTAANSLLGDKFTSELPENTAVPAFGGAQLQLGPFNNGTLTVKGPGNTTPANMVIPDVQCTNGVVHVIDKVLL
jgi:uncharacterized surface protein with fasciclin (FAS1) repeats